MDALCLGLPDSKVRQRTLEPIASLVGDNDLVVSSLVGAGVDQWRDGILAARRRNELPAFVEFHAKCPHLGFGELRRLRDLAGCDTGNGSHAGASFGRDLARELILWPGANNSGHGLDGLGRSRIESRDGSLNAFHVLGERAIWCGCGGVLFATLEGLSSVWNAACAAHKHNRADECWAIAEELRHDALEIGVFAILGIGFRELVEKLVR